MSNRALRGRGATDATPPANDATDPETGDEQSSDDDPRISEDDVFDVLRNGRRRIVLTYLLENDGRATVERLTKRVAAEEYDVDPEDVTAEQYKRVYTGIYQGHLPRMDDLGVVEFDEDRKTVTLAESAGRVESYLRRGDDPGAPLGELAAAAAVAAVVSLGVLGVGPLGSLPVVWWTVLAALALVGFSLFQLYAAGAPRPGETG